MVKIGHASIDENGRISGGQAGDQTGREVYITNWYNKGWNVMLRPNDPAVAEKMVAACIAGCNNNKIGYDQGQRNTLRARAKEVGFDLAKIKTACETDCSAFMSVCAEAAGVDMEPTYVSGNAPTTRSMRTRFVNTGAFKAYTDEKFLTSDKYLMKGDILIKEGSHTVMVLEDGELAPKPGPKPIIHDSKVNIYYKVKTRRHGWLPEVKNLEDYAGIPGNEIIGFMARVDKGSIKYQAHDAYGWNNWIDGYDENDFRYGFAGNNMPIDMIRVYYFTPSDIRPYKCAYYRVAPLRKGYYDWQKDDVVGNGMDGYAGANGRYIDRIQMEVK